MARLKVGDICRVLSDTDKMLPSGAVVCVKEVLSHRALAQATRHAFYDCELLFGTPLDPEPSNLYPYYDYELEVIRAPEA